jgi:PAS domain S-box-containing protein
VVKTTIQFLSKEALSDVCGLCRGDWLEVAQVGVFVVDAARIHYVNPHLAALFGYSPDQLIGRMSPLELISHDERDAARRAMEGCLLGDGGVPHSFSALRSDGAIVHVEALATCTAYRGMHALVGLVIDQSDRHQAERALRDQLNFTSQLIEAIPAPVFFKDAAGRYLGGNRAFEGYIGHQRDFLIGKSVFDIAPRDLAETYAAADQDLFDHPGTQTYEAEVLSADGSRRNVVFNKATFLDGQGELGGLVGVILDVSERRRAERQLFDSQERLRSLTARLESVREEERTRISREIHDELGQTLTGLKMDLAWLQGRIEPAQQDIGEKLRQMSALIDATTQTVRKISWELRPGPLDTLGLSAAIEWLARQFQMRNGIRCKLDLPAEPPEIDVARASAIFRILQELFTNVTRHAGASSVEVRLTADVRRLVLTVKDNGRGMAAAADWSPQSLGLLGVRERALHLGGTVEIRTRPEIKGTKITVVIPLPETRTDMR